MPENADVIVNEDVLEDAQIEAAFTEPEESSRSRGLASAPTPTTDPKEEEKNITYTQWSLGGNGRFIPTGTSISNLVPGVYEPFSTPGAWGLERLRIASDEIYELPDMSTVTILNEAEAFWNNEAKYRRFNLLYKRGIIMYGPPGSGKTVTIKLLIKKLIERDGIVLLVNHIGLSTMCLKAIKRIEPQRNLICIFEDIDDIIYNQGESHVLSMLDGEHNVDRVMNIATTNYPDKLGARIINRPSRFDRRICVSMPTAESRAFYLSKTTCGLSDSELEKWVKDTENMSVAHLRELVAAVYCLGQSYEDVISRLKDMSERVKVEDDFKRNKIGLSGKVK